MKPGYTQRIKSTRIGKYKGKNEPPETAYQV